MKLIAAWYIMWKYMDEKVEKNEMEKTHSSFIRMWQNPAAEQMEGKLLQMWKHGKDMKYVECEKW